MMIDENKSRGLMIAGYRTSAPAGGTKDNRGVDAVASAYNATADVGTFTRRIVPAKYLRPFTQERNKWAKYHRQRLVPFERAAKGEGIGKAPVIKEYCNDFRMAERSVMAGIDTIMFGFDSMLEEVKDFSGNLFEEGEIPSKEKFRDSFSFELIKPRAVENPDDLLDVFDNEFVDDVRESLEKSMKKAVSDSLRPTFQSLLKMSKSLRDYDPEAGRDSAFRKTLVTNVKENAELLSKVNFTDDEMISLIQKEILDNLVQFDERQLKDSEPLRNAIADKADEIANNFEMFGLEQ